MKTQPTQPAAAADDTSDNHYSNTTLSRRRFLVRTGQLSALTLGGVPSLSSAANAQTSVSISEAFDREVEQFMSARKVPGGALAVTKNWRLVYARGYGWGDRDKKEAAKPDSPFRIASVSKPITAVATLKLVEAGRLEMNARAFDLLPLKSLLPDGKQPDERLKQITVRHLLHHTGGWDRDKSGDPMFRSLQIARAAGVPAPAMQPEIIRYMLGQKLDFDPGARYAYSNFGYCVLGRIIEKVSGQTYDSFVQKEVLRPANIHHMRLGKSLEAGRAEGEVKYYMAKGQTGRSVFPNQPGDVPEPYGGFCLEAMDSHGAWLASAVDLVRFASAVDKSDGGRLLKPETCQILFEPPAPPVSRKRDGSISSPFYACGWQVRSGTSGNTSHTHNGSLPGTATSLVKRSDGVQWAMLFNQRSQDPKLPDNALDAKLQRAADSVTDWPQGDLFPHYD